ncbi:aladin-like [Macrosteles quadrilineatus]|uniref:aladin-like n=1 Tax=Macrosteles quadrilineatus TaxID=74068 RepID=UPI0023E23BE2|nr:aladin-like [Macrosteles quadrilineatus]
MICSLSDFPPLPESNHLPVCLTEGKVQYSAPMFTNVHIYTTALSSHPHIVITNEMLHPSMSKEDGSKVFLPVSQTLWKKLQHTWYEKGFVPMLEVAAHPRENQGFIVLEFVAKQMLAAIRFASTLHNVVPGYKKKVKEDLMVSQNPVYSSSNIRCLAWHPHCTRLAVAASDDSIRVYLDNSQLTPLLKCRGQRFVSCLVWRPLCGSELAVGCEVGVLVWHVDPNSVITRPSASNTQLLTRRGHTHVSDLAWSPQGDLLVSGSARDQTMYVWAVGLDNAVPLKRVGGGGISLVSWSPDSLKLFAATTNMVLCFRGTCYGSARDQTMYVWAVGLDNAVPLKRVGGGGISLVSWSPDSLKLFAATTNMVFRVWETCQWNADRWALTVGRVVSAVWSPCSSLVLFAVSLEPVIYSLMCSQTAGVFQEEDRRAATPLIDLTPVELDNGERVGGEVSSLAWDKKGRYLAVTFKQCDIIAVFMTSLGHTLHVSPCCFIKGVANESPAVISFQNNFNDGANLTIGWSSGRVQYFPIIYSELESHDRSYGNITNYDLPNVSSYASPSAFHDYTLN